jgi:hypothetical protein
VKIGTMGEGLNEEAYIVKAISDVCLKTFEKG